MLFDFSRPETVDDWISMNDIVMGGQSVGDLEATADGTARFSGTVSFENGGGFASIRSRPRRHDLRNHAGLSLRVRGDGRRYKLNLKTDDSGVLYQVAFETREGTWQTLFLPFDEFEPSFRGRAVPDAPELDRSRILSMGLMISDRQEGPFGLEVAWIRAAEISPAS